MSVKRSSWFLMLASFGVVGGVVACGSVDDGPAPPPADSGNGARATLAERSEAVSAEVANAAVVEANRLVFPGSMSALLAKKPGDILIADRQQPGTSGSNPHGFLRRVKAVRHEGSQIVVDTEVPALTEAVRELSFRTRVRGPSMTENGPVGDRLLDGPGYQAQGGKKIEILNFTGKQLFNINESVQANGKTIGFNAFAKVNTGYLNFTPDYDIDTDIKPPSISLDGISGPEINKISVAAIGTLDAKLVINAGIKLTGDMDSETFTQLVAQKIFKAKDATLADYPFDLGSIKAGPISVPLNGGFKAVLSCVFDWKGGAEVTVGGNANASLKLGLKYENKDFSPIFEKSANFEQVGPDYQLDGLVRVKCSITPTLEVKLWDVGMAQVWAKAYAGMAGSLTCGAPSGDPPNQTQTGTVSGEAVAGVRAGVKAKLDLFGLVKYEKECTLFDLDKKGSYTKNFTLPGGGKATCDGAALPFDLEEPPAPEKCFGNGGGQGGSGGAGGGSGSPCGNGTLDPGEACDGSDFGGKTCKSLTFNDNATGNPTCTSTCTIDKSTCDVGATCGDICTESDKPQKEDCGECQKKVCAANDYCCLVSWDSACIESAKGLCNQCKQ